MLVALFALMLYMQQGDGAPPSARDALKVRISEVAFIDKIRGARNNFIELESQSGTGLLSHYTLIVIRGHKVTVRTLDILLRRICQNMD